MYLVTKTYGHELGLSACFRQHRAKSHCRFLHGYPLSFKLTFAADKLDSDNWVLDFGGLKPVKAWLVETFDHRTLVAEDDPMLKPYFRSLHDDQIIDLLVVPFVGCEGFARYVFDWVDNWLGDELPLECDIRGLRLVEVEVREHGGNSAIYRGDA